MTLCNIYILLLRDIEEIVGADFQIAIYFLRHFTDQRFGSQLIAIASDRGEIHPEIVDVQLERIGRPGLNHRPG